MDIKLVLTDIDGVWTDGGMYYGESGNELKKFHTYDSAGVLWCRMAGIKVGILTGEHTQIVARRAAKLQIDYLFQGAKNKLAIAKTLCDELEIKMTQVAYLGDDINDIELLRAAGVSACPESAPEYIHQYCDAVIEGKGGSGIFRKFVERHVLAEALPELIEQYREDHRDAKNPEG